MPAMNKKKLLIEIEKLKAPKGCDWNFLCGYMLALRRVKDKLK